MYNPTRSFRLRQGLGRRELVSRAARCGHRNNDNSNSNT